MTVCRAPSLVVAAVLAAVCSPSMADSTCFGRVGSGRLQGGVKLPSEGTNFEAYSSVGVLAGRTFVHSKVRQIVVDAYGAAAKSVADVRFVYGETGLEHGGRFRPHRTHQNGLSVDFMVPVRARDGRASTIPRSPFNKFGYALEFDSAGRLDDLTIDFDAIAEHLYALDRAARARGARVALVIFDAGYLPRILSSRRGTYLKANVPFIKGKPWIRHDEHYHVDFAVACRPG